MASALEFFDDFYLDDDSTNAQSQKVSRLEQQFTEACAEIKEIKKLVGKDEVDKFFAKYQDIIDQYSIIDQKSTATNANLLHILVDAVTHNGVQAKNIEYLVRRLVTSFPVLLKQPNKNDYSPIHLAINDSHNALVNYMVTTCVEMMGKHEYSLNEALSAKVKDEKTCLHLAIDKKLEPETLEILIRHASDEVLAMQDKSGKTPMHYVMLFINCGDVGVELINTFLERDFRMIQNKRGVSNTFLDAIDNRGLSVYCTLRTDRTRILGKYQDWLKSHESPTENSQMACEPIIATVDKIQGPGERASMSSKSPKSVTSGQLVDGHSPRSGNELSNNNNKERATKKAESLTGSTTATTPGSISGGGNDSRDASQDRLPTLSGQDGADRASSEVTSNTSAKRRGTDHVEVVLGKEEEKPAMKSITEKTTASVYISILLKNSAAVLFNLKVYYMRTRSTEMATSFLYGANTQDVHISFDYDNLPRKLLWNEFLKRFGSGPQGGRLSFDNVLQYVTLPRVQVNVTGRHADLEREAEKKSKTYQIGALGRRDTKYFLNWLFDKGVRHIISLSVEDSGRQGERVHGDQIIQQSLERLIIERLDWQKMDLDPATILRVGCKIDLQEGSYSTSEKNQTDVQPVSQHLRQLSLRWSGSNVALRAWSEPEGLVLLPKLEKIKLIKPSPSKEYDNSTWISGIVRQFQDRLNANRKAIRDQTMASNERSIADGTEFGDVEVTTVNIDDEEHNVSTSNVTNPLASPFTAGDINPHRWLDSADRFVGQMAPFWQDIIESRADFSTGKKVDDDVLIALIDDGVDALDLSLPDRVLKGKSFDYHDGKARPSYSSAQGHGTVMASMIPRMCPMAKVYPIRLKTHLNADGERRIDANYAAQAIQAALNKNATIISMSWTLPMQKENSGVKSRLHDVLQKAVNENVLMFCSAPDNGKFTELDYPSGPWSEHFFRIGAAAADGTTFQWTPDVDITYVLPGVDVIINHNLQTTERTTRRVEDVVYETGSSVATALAAGLAAMIIHCVKASISTIETANQKNCPTMGITIARSDADKIAEPKAMKRAFARLGTVTRANFIQVWEKLDRMSDTLEALNGDKLNPEKRLNCLKEFAEFGCELASAIRA